jgi:glycosyltransferase involved in cell wall biosynthesis
MQYLLEWGALLMFTHTVVVSRYLERMFTSRLAHLGVKRSILYLPFAANRVALESRPAVSSTADTGEIAKRRVVFLGKFYANYGLREILLALERLSYVRKDWTATLLGNGPLYSEMTEFIVSKGLSDRIFLPGFKTGTDLEAYLQAADVFVSPMTDTPIDWARCPGKIFIYMMFQKPIVTCKIGENYEALGEDGYYYEPQDVDSMVAAIGGALDAARSFVAHYDVTRFTWESRATTYLGWLASVHPLAGTGPQRHKTSRICNI